MKVYISGKIGEEVLSVDAIEAAEADEPRQNRR